jgi:putative methionine-R-sulfoxide reductase with GAF domain
MRGTYKNLALLTALLFTAGILGMSYYLYIFPERLANGTQALDLLDVPLLAPVMKELYVLAAIVFALGFISVLLFLVTRNSSDEQNVVYVEKFKDRKDKADQSDSDKNEDSESDVEVEEINTLLKQEKDPKKASEKALSILANKMEASQGAIYIAGKEDGKNIISLFASYAFVIPESQKLSYEFGEGLAGQVAKEPKLINISEIPEGYITVLSGLGEANPAHLVICPVLHNDKLIAVAEIAGFKAFSSADEQLIKKTLDKLAVLLDKSASKKEKDSVN